MGKGIVPSPAKQFTKTEKARASVKVPTRTLTTDQVTVPSPQKKLLATDGQQKPKDMPTGLVQKYTAPAPQAE